MKRFRTLLILVGLAIPTYALGAATGSVHASSCCGGECCPGPCCLLMR